MKQSEVTKTIKKLNQKIEQSKTDAFYDGSIGFQRLSVLPSNVRRNFNLALLANGNSINEVVKNQKEFLGNMTEGEYVNWLRNA